MEGRILAYLMQGLILSVTVFSYLKGDIPVAISGTVAFGMTLVPLAFGLKTHIAVPWGALFCIALSLFLHVAGYAFDWYNGFYPYYDKIAHVVSSFTVALLGFLIVVLLHRLNRMRCSVRMITLFILVFTLALGAAWEILEFAVDRLFGTHLQYGLDDTIYDLIFDGIGGLIVAGTGAIWLSIHDRAIAPRPRGRSRTSGEDRPSSEHLP
jgi:ABC-type Fe3+-siderophore transport system permease subunit